MQSKKVVLLILKIHPNATLGEITCNTDYLIMNTNPTSEVKRKDFQKILEPNFSKLLQMQKNIFYN